MKKKVICFSLECFDFVVNVVNIQWLDIGFTLYV